MSVRRLEHIPGFNIDRVAAAAGDDADVLRMENLDTPSFRSSTRRTLGCASAQECLSSRRPSECCLWTNRARVCARTLLGCRSV